MPFGTVPVWDPEAEIAASQEATKESPMPFGTVPVWDAVAHLYEAIAVFESPMPFGTVPVWDKDLNS